jgi:hypothetical protein
MSHTHHHDYERDEQLRERIANDVIEMTERRIMRWGYNARSCMHETQVSQHDYFATREPICVYWREATGELIVETERGLDDLVVELDASQREALSQQIEAVGPAGSGDMIDRFASQTHSHLRFARNPDLKWQLL